MTREVAKAHAGDVIHLDLFRDGKERTVDVKSGLRPSEATLALNGGIGGGDEDSGGQSGVTPTPHSQILGMSLTPIDPATRKQFSIADPVKGVFVDSVKGASDANDKGLRRGDVIVRAGDREVASANDVSAAVGDWKKAGRSSIPLAISRGGRTLFVPVKIEG
jgi:serine protease Do